MIAPYLVIAALLAFIAWREQQTRSERAQLLDRIQAPEVVVQRRMIESGQVIEPEEPDMGPWSLPLDEDDER